MYISSACDVVIEVTRRCNMCCAHCLRGDAEAVDIQERYIDAFLDSFANAGFASLSNGSTTAEKVISNHIQQPELGTIYPLMQKSGMLLAVCTETL